MPAANELPVIPSQNQKFRHVLGDTTYNFRLTYDTAQDGCWVMDIGDESGVPIVTGIPLLSGVDLVAQYRHLGFAGSIVVTTDRGAGEVPTFDGLGVTSRVLYVPD